MLRNQFIILFFILVLGTYAEAAAPRRIVSLKPNITEILFGLGAGEAVIGVTDHCDFPEAARKKHKVGAYINPSLEAILDLQPDLVIGEATGSKENVERLKALGIRTVILSFRNLTEIYAAIETMGKETGREAEAGKMIATMRQGLQSRRVVNEHPRVLLLIGHRPPFAVGRGVFIDEILTLAGGNNIAADSALPFPQFSEEAVIERAPEVIIDLSMGSEGTQSRRQEAIAYWQKFSSVPAVKNGRIYFLDPNVLLRPGPRLPEALRLLEKTLAKPDKPA